MIIFLDTSGQIISDDSSEQIGRNSSNAAQIYIVTKMSPTTKFFFSFRLPNGTNLYGGFAENSEYSASLIAENVEGYNVFVYPVRDNITEYAGTVLYTVYGVTESMRTSGTSSFSVNPAVRIDIGTEPTPNVWEDILALISRVENDKLDKVGAGDSKRAYTVNADGTQGVTPLTETPAAYEIPTYKDGGALAVNLGGSEDAVPLSYVDSVEKHVGTLIDGIDRRVENLEEAANGNILSHIDEVGIGSVINVPEGSLKYASLNRLGAHTTLGAPTVVPEVSEWTLVEGSYAGATFENGVLTIDSGLNGIVPVGAYAAIANNTYGNPRRLSKGLYSLNVNVDGGYPIDYTVRASANGATILNKTFNVSAEKKMFVLTEDTDDFTLTATCTPQPFVYYQQDLNDAIVKEGSFETVVPRSVKVVGKNLVPPTFYDFENWYATGSYGRFIVPTPIPKSGNYIINAEKNSATNWGTSIFVASVSKDGGDTWTVPPGMSDGWLLTSGIDILPLRLSLEKGDLIRFGIYPNNQSTIDNIVDVQLEYGETDTAYAPYTEYEKALPTPVIMRLFASYGISAEVCDHIDLDTLEGVQMVGTRAYATGDEDNTEVLTDGTTTLYALAPEDIERTDFSEYFTADNVSDVLTVEGKGWIYLTDEDIAYDMTFQAKI